MVKETKKLIDIEILGGIIPPRWIKAEIPYPKTIEIESVKISIPKPPIVNFGMLQALHIRFETSYNGNIQTYIRRRGLLLKSVIVVYLHKGKILQGKLNPWKSMV